MTELVVANESPKTVKKKYGVFYTDGSSVGNPPIGAGAGIHGYVYDTIEGCRYAGIPHLVGPGGYEPKLTGAQLKDAEYNPVLSGHGFDINVKETKVLKESDILVVDAIYPLERMTNNQGEMLAFINLMESTEIQCEYYIIYTDSTYLLDGWNGRLDSWIAGGWVNSSGPVKNRDLWERVKVILDEKKDIVDFRKIKAHDGLFGNECADRNAKFGSYAASMGDEDGVMVIDSIHNSDYWEPIKLLPSMLHQKWSYVWSESQRAECLVDDVNHYMYFMGDHTKNTDDAEVLGKHVSDSGFSLVLSREKAPVIDQVAEYHRDCLWKGVHDMYRSEIVISVNTSNLMRPKIIWEIGRVPRTTQIHHTPANEMVSSQTKELISKAHNPPRLSYRMRDVEDEYKAVLFDYLIDNGHTVEDWEHSENVVMYNDVTDRFYSEVTKKEKTSVVIADEYDLVVKALDFDVVHPCSDKKAKIRLTRGIDLPSRGIVSKAAHEDTKAFIATVKFDEIIFRHYLILDTPDGIGVWSSYACQRVLDKPDM